MNIRQLSTKINLFINHNRQVIMMIVALLAFAVGCFLVAEFGVNVVFWDEWDIYPALLQHYQQGTLTFSLLFSQLNEHRLFFPRLIYLGLGLATNLNLIIFMFVTQVEFLIVALIFKNELKRDHNFPLWLWTLIVALIFSWRQWENIFMSLQICFVFLIIVALLSFYFYQRLIESKKIIYLLPTCLFALVASFTNASGLFVWICLLLISFYFLLTTRKNKTNSLFYLKLTQLLSIATIVTWLLYFVGYTKPPTHPSIIDALVHFPHTLIYFFAALGNAVFSPMSAAIIYGGCCLVNVMISGGTIIKKQRVKNNLFLLGVIIFVLISLASLALGRAGFGVIQALSSRYVTFALPLVVALLILNYRERKTNELMKIVNVIFLTLTIFGFATGLVRSYRELKQTALDRQQIARYVATYQTQPNVNLQKAYPQAVTVRQWVPFLQTYHYSLFGD